MPKQDWKKTHTIYWSNELEDDFNQTISTRPEVPKDYHYGSKCKFFSWVLYYLIAKPILGLYCFFHGIKVVGRKNLKRLKGEGAFIYANHVALSDAFKYQAYVIPSKRVNIIGYSDTLSLKFVGKLVRGLGYIPIPHDLHNMGKMEDYIKECIKKKQYILIFPEAHIWPYYTKIRNFKDVSFHYPASIHAPIIPMVTIWRGNDKHKPKQTIVIGKPIKPFKGESLKVNKEYLHEQCLLQMKAISEKYSQPEYIKYIKPEKD